MTYEDRELLAGLARADTAMLSLGLRIMDSSASVTDQRSDCADVSDPAHPGARSGIVPSRLRRDTPVAARSATSRVVCAARRSSQKCRSGGAPCAVVDFDGEPASRVAVPGSPLRDGGSRGSAIGGEIITLGDQAPGLTDEQLRFRLLTLAGHTAPSHRHPDANTPPAENSSPTIAWASSNSRSVRVGPYIARSSQPPATSHQPPATSHPATSHQPPATSHQPPATSHQPPATRRSAVRHDGHRPTCSAAS
jgi:hypothetical protein